MSKRKVLAIVLVLAMVLALPVVAMADNAKPVATQATTKPSTIQSVTIGGVTASYQVDGYGNPSSPTYDNTQVFIRAMKSATSREEELKSMSIVIKLSTGYSLSGGTLSSTYTPTYNANKNTYTFSGVNLLNTAYTIIVDNATYIIAAGLEDSDQAPVAIPSTDPLAVSSFSYNSGANADVYRVTVQNPCIWWPDYQQ